MALTFASLKASKNRLPFRAHNVFIDGGKAAGGTPTFPPLGINPTEPPTNAAEGGLYYDDDLHALMQYTGSAWEEIGASVTPTSLGSTTSMTAGTGITTGTGTVYQSRVTQIGNIIKTDIFVDLTGLNSGGTDGDIIGVNATANSHFGQWTTAVNGTYFRGQMSCAELVAGGEPDIDVYSATLATGTEDVAISGITGQVVLLAAAADWTQGMTKPFTGILAPDKYLYLVASGGATDATYTAGMFVLEFWGYVTP